MASSDNGADKMFLFRVEISYSCTKVPIIYKHSPGVTSIHENKNKINNQVSEIYMIYLTADGLSPGGSGYYACT